MNKTSGKSSRGKVKILKNIEIVSMIASQLEELRGQMKKGQRIRVTPFAESFWGESSLCNNTHNCPSVNVGHSDGIKQDANGLGWQRYLKTKSQSIGSLD